MYSPSETDELARALGVAIMDIQLVEEAETGMVGVLDPDTGDIIGAGVDEEEAVRDALATVREWRLSEQ